MHATRWTTLLTWRDGGLIRYNAVWQNVAAFFYVGLAQGQIDLGYVTDLVLFLLFSLAGTAYGYLVNDFADVELDRRAGKPNVFHGTSRRWAAGVVALVFGLMLLGGLPFLRRPAFLPLWLLWMLAATFYSLPPLRLKERGAIGLTATILAQQPLPAAMGFAALGHLQSWGALLFIVYIALRGICSDVGHQMRDRARDVAAGATTFAARRSQATITRLYGLALELETLGLGAVLLLLLLDLPPVHLGGHTFAIAWPLLFGYLALLPFTLGRAWRALSAGVWVDPYDESAAGPTRDLLHLMHQAFPAVGLPLYLALWLTVAYWPNAIFVLWLVLLYRLYDPHRWLAVWPLRLLVEDRYGTCTHE